MFKATRLFLAQINYIRFAKLIQVKYCSISKEFIDYISQVSAKIKKDLI